MGTTAEAVKIGLTPFGNTYLSELTDPESQTKGGIIIPETARKETGEAVILAAGLGAYEDGVWQSPDFALIGRRVLIGKWMGTEVMWTDGDGNERIGVVLKPSEIIAVVEE